MRDAFAVLFFASVGMLFNPRSLLEVPLIILTVLFVVVVIKPLAALLTVRALGQPLVTAIPIGAAFSQVGEFSFILGAVALGLGLINEAGWNALVAASIISIALNPYLYHWARRLASPKPSIPIQVRAGGRPAINSNRCILIGYGPIGKIVHKLLVDRGTDITVIDLNLDSIHQLRDAGHSALYGDVRQPGTLIEAGLETAGSLILSADVEYAAEIITQARLLNPELRVLARCTHLRDAPALRRAGASVVAVGEAEVGVTLAEIVKTSDQMIWGDTLDNREAIRRSLYEAHEELCDQPK
jgi:CPA2 family monovalent cation:H+ antiporter-2